MCTRSTCRRSTRIRAPGHGRGEFVGAFSDRPEVVAVREYLATAEFANSRAAEGAWFSAHKGLDLDLLEVPTDRLGAEILRDPEPCSASTEAT